MVDNPPEARFSQECCEGAKKQTAYAGDEIFNPDCKWSGLRQAESGVRSNRYSSCFSPADDKNDIAQYRPLFFWKDRDKQECKKHYNIFYSDAYEIYGLKRTGCAGCPLGSRFEEELKAMKKYEPKLYRAACSIFADSYEYMRKYREYKEQHKHEIVGQMGWQDIA